MRALLFSMPDVIWGFDLCGRLPNLGLVSIAGNVDKELCDVRVCDLVAVGGDIRDFVRGLIRCHKPDVVGLSCMSFQYPSALALAKLVKSIDREIKVVLGGYHPTLCYKELASDRDVLSYVDFIVRGEGEATFNELMRALCGGLDFRRVKGLSFKCDGKFVHNEPRVPLSPDSISLPDRKARIIREGFHIFGRRADVIETSRGCTFDCNFCCITSMYGRSFRVFSIERVMKDIEAVKEWNVKAIFIVDDNIMLNVRRFERLCDAIINYGHNDLDYFIQSSVRGILSRRDLVKKMARAGFKGVFLGIERGFGISGFLNIERKVGDVGYIKKAVNLLKGEGIIVMGGFILGCPEDDKKTFYEALNIARELQLDIPVFFLLTPYPGTRVRDELSSLGLLVNDDSWSSYDCFTPNVRTKYLTTSEVSFLHWKIYREWFNTLSWILYNRIKRHYPNYFLRILIKIFPRHLWNHLLMKFGIKSEEELWRDELSKGRAIYSRVRGLRGF